MTRGRGSQHLRIQHALVFTGGDPKKEEKVINGEDSIENGGDEEPDDDDIYYDKNKSFFDNISCEATERAKG